MVDKKLSKYLFIKRNIFYFSRHVPKDLRQHYNCDRIVKSLKTKCTKQASKLSQSMNQNLETYWFNLRLNSAGIPFKNLISKVDPIQSLTHAPKLSEALEIYFKLKGHGKGGLNKGWRKLILRFPNRIMVGTDSCCGRKERYDELVHELRTYFFPELPKDVREKVAYNNALKVFGLIE